MKSATKPGVYLFIKALHIPLRSRSSSPIIIIVNIKLYKLLYTPKPQQIWYNKVIEREDADEVPASHFRGQLLIYISVPEFKIVCFFSA